MQFGYFTLSDNRYPDNPRSAGQFIRDMCEHAVLAERLGMHSVWIGEHHFNRRGCVPVPQTVLAYIAARTERVRLGPGVVVLPIHHPIHVAEEWATLDQLSGGRVDFATGRGYDAHEYAPFGADFQASADSFPEALEAVDRLWNEDGPVSHEGRFWRFENVELCPRPVQRPFRPYMGSFSRFSMELAARFDWNLVLAPFAAAQLFGGLEQAVAAYREICDKAGKPVRKIKCSYFVHIGDRPGDQEYGAQRLIDYFTLSGLRKKTTMGTTLPPTMAYYAKIGAALTSITTADLGDHSILLGSPQRIVDRLKQVEAAGLDEVLLYFNYGNKPDAMVREQMARFMAEVAPAFR